jgi:hypothetical protein
MKPQEYKVFLPGPASSTPRQPGRPGDAASRCRCRRGPDHLAFLLDKKLIDGKPDAARASTPACWPKPCGKPRPAGAPQAP